MVRRVCLSHALTSLEGDTSSPRALNAGLNILQFESESEAHQIASDLLLEILAAVSVETKDTEHSISKESFAYISGVEIHGDNPCTNRDNMVREPQASKAELDGLTRDEIKLSARFQSAATIIKQLEKLEAHSEIDQAIENLPHDVVERLKTPLEEKNRFDERKSEIYTARLTDPVQELPTETLFQNRNFQIGVAGMLGSFGASYALELPLLALLNFFFAAMIGQVLFRRIDRLEDINRAQARRRAVDEADARNERARSEDGLAMERAASDIGVELMELREQARSVDARQRSKSELSEALKSVCGEDTYESVESKLTALREKIALLHEEILELNSNELRAKPAGKSNLSSSALEWDRNFFRTLKTNFRDDFSAKLVEPSALDYLQRLSEGRYDGLTLAEDGALTVVGPDEIFPVSYQRLNEKNRRLVELALRFGVVNYLIEKGVSVPFLVLDQLKNASTGRRLRFKDALEVLSEKTQVIVVSTSDDWPN